MASPEDYESLPDSVHPSIHMIAGALAGVGEHCVMYPVDVVKVYLKIIFSFSHSHFYIFIDADAMY